jgi:hypothetical protein
LAVGCGENAVEEIARWQDASVEINSVQHSKTDSDIDSLTRAPDVSIGCVVKEQEFVEWCCSQQEDY